MPGMGLNASLLMGARSLSVQRSSLEVTGHNLANVNTPNAARQRTSIMQDITIPLGLGQQGMGSFVESIESLRSSFLDEMVKRQNSLQGLYETRDQMASLVQDAMGESLSTSETSATEGISSATGIQQSLNKFFDAWQDLAADPSSTIKRNEVITRGENLAMDIQSSYDRVLDVKAGIFEQAGSVTSEINSLASDIADLNDEIARIEINTQSTANDLRDRRQELVEQLSTLVNIDVTLNGTNDAMIDIELTDANGSGNDVILVNGVDGAGAAGTHSLSVTAAFTKAANTVLQISATSATGTDYAPIAGAQEPTEGELGGLLLAANSDIGSQTTVPGAAPASSAPLTNKLHYFAGQMIALTNTLHATGYDQAGAAGGAFFTAGGTAANISVAITDSDDIAAAGDDGAGASLGVLDGTVAQSIADLRDNANTGELYREAVADIGIIAQQAKRNAQAQELITQQINNQREAVSGISIDEEMTNMIAFQRAFEASARFITVIDQMMQRVVSMAQ
ncbi:MAG: flagellar hook-associated protein FlgK [Verrucomicrobiota bacterium]